ncbi:MAG: helix-turn-helix transcriptional regulator [bacterium]|nr:helix-turn-helix transcriptional regulator [bacterium]
MGFLNLSKNIVRLRKEKEITQEALAEFTGVTKASVSKWETGTTTPDIQILPVLAAFFNVTVDELIGYESQLTKTQISYYYHKLAKSFGEQPFDNVWEESMGLVKKYYGCYPFLLQMAILWLNHSILAKSQEQKMEVLKQAESICNRIIENAEDSALCENTRSVRALIWLQQNRADLVIEYMEKDVMDVNRIGDQSTLLPLAYLTVGKVTMAEKSSQIGLYRNLMELLNNSIYLLMSAQEEEYCNNVIHRTDQVLEAFQVEQLHPNIAAVYQYQVALKLCGIAASKSADLEKADLEYYEKEIYSRIEKYAQAIAQLYQDGIKLHGDDFFYLLTDWFSDLELGTKAIRDGKVILSDVINSLKHPAFTMLQDKKRMERVIRQLEAIVS